MTFYPIVVLGKNENTVIVRPKERRDIINIKVPEGHILFLQLLEIDKWYPDTEYQVFIDGEFVYSYKREGRYLYDPPYVVKRELRIVGINNSNEELPMGVFIDGVVLIKK